MNKILQLLILFISINTSLLAQFETLVISINDESPKLDFKGSRNVIYNRSFDNYLKEALSEVILLTYEAGWNQTFQATSWSSFFEASKEQGLQEMVDDVTSGSAADKLGRLTTTDFKLLRDVTITEVDQRSSAATQFDVRLTLVEVNSGKEFNKSDFIDIKGRNTRERGESIKKGLTKLLAELFMDKFPREPILNVNSLDNRAAVPVIKNLSISGKHGRDITSFLSAVIGDQNIQADDLTFQITGQPTNGRARITNRNKLIYTPNRAFTGTDTVDYFVSYIDKNGFAIRSQPKTISIKISNTKPVAKSGLERVRQDSDKTFILQGNDSDGDKLVYEIISQPLRGKLYIEDSRVPGQFTYTPNRNVIGSDKFSYRVFDGADYSDEVVFNLEITKVNKVPVARSFNVKLLHDTDYEDFFQGQDGDGDKLKYFVTKTPANGKLSSDDDNKFTYRPNRGFVGQDTFNYRAEDSNGARSNTATILVEVTNKKPEAISRSYNGSFSEEFIIDLEGRDPDVVDDSRLSVKVYKQPFGSLEKVRGTKSQYRYKNISGVEEDDIIFQVFDGVETSDFAKISLKLDKNNTQVSSTVNKANSKPSTKTVRSSKPRTQVKPVAKPKPTRVPSQQQASNDKDDDGGSNMTLILVLLLVVVLAAAGGGGGGGSDPTGGVDIGITIP